MARLTWLADELRKAGLTVVEVDGWKTRGSSDFDPVGVTWHATAGSRTSSARGEVNVILRGSTSAPPPIAQIMAYRDGVLWLCAAGRCNHNKVGWAGPNRGLGNTRLLGIEMANDNRGEPWPAVQLDAVRRATAVIMRRLGADPMKRLAAHYEHQPYAGRPAGEGSTKSDPYGVVMTKERPRVAAIMNGDAMPNLTNDDVDLILDRDAIPNLYPSGAGGKTVTVATALKAAVAADVKLTQVLAALKALTGKDFTDEQAIITGVLAGLPAEKIAAGIPQGVAQQVVDLLAARMAA